MKIENLELGTHAGMDFPAWDDIEVSPVREESDTKDAKFVEVCEESEAQFWSVYLHDVEGGVYCVADLPTKEYAYALAELIKKASESYEQK